MSIPTNTDANRTDSQVSVFKTLPSLLEQLVNASEKIIRDWTNAPEFIAVISAHRLSVEAFQRNYAHDIFEYFIEVLRQKQSLGDCPTTHQLILLCIDHEITVSEVYRLCVHFRESVITFLLDNQLLTTHIYQELCRIFDHNLSSLLQDYAATIAENQQAKKSMEAIVENSLNEIYIFDCQTLKFTYANRGARSNSGYSLPELTTMHPYDLKPQLNREQFLELIQPLLERTQERLVFETLHRRKDGSTYHADIRLQRMAFDHADHLVAIINDVTQLKMADLIHHHYEINKAIIHNCSDAIICMDETQHISLFNPSAEKIFGYSASEAIGQTLGILLPDGLEKQHANYIHEFANQPNLGAQMVENRAEVQGKRKDGTLFPIEASISKARIKGQLMFTALVRDVSIRHQAEAEMRRLANTDWLTGLSNRHHFELGLNEAICYTKRFPAHKTGLILIDLDHFKQVNDNLGHKAGDELLKVVATILKDNVRSIDVVGRLGGDEFGIVVRGIDHEEDMIFIAKKIASKLANRPTHNPFEANVNMSIGMTLCPEQGTDLDKLMCQADKALYQAKNAGRNGYKLYRPETR